jgi:hypothetical protein
VLVLAVVGLLPAYFIHTTSISSALELIRRKRLSYLFVQRLTDAILGALTRKMKKEEEEVTWLSRFNADTMMHGHTLRVISTYVYRLQQLLTL